MDFTIQEQNYIITRFEKMISVCTRCRGEDNIARVRKAFEFAHKAHYPTRRKSGEPYILHPISVAQICGTELNLGTTSMIAALLHDVVEDTEYTVEDISKNFGEEVATMVDGLTKISGAINLTNSMQSENFKKILLTMAQDIRVILIKLADRLHNIRTLDSMPRHKQLKIASETFYIFAPIANRLGLYAVKIELEDNAFRIKQPTEYAEIEQKLKNTESQRTIFINKFSLPIAARLTEKRYDFDVTGRSKSMFSIYQKMIKKAVPFEEIYDLFAIRIIFTPKENDGSEKEQCFKIYSIVTDIYTPRPDRLRDWVTSTKENGYEALHSTVMGPNGRWVEVQIRTRRMDEIAEFGYAAHFKYKGQQSNERNIENWLSSIRETMHKADPDAIDFVESVKSALTTSEIIVFTPKGDNYSFPIGATALDFAYSVHPNVGHKAISAKVNHQNMPLNYHLKNGDQIEIITSQKQKPQPEWLEIVQTAKARYYLRKYLNQEIEEQALIGQKLLEQKLEEMKLTITPRIIEKIKTYYDIQPDKEDKIAFARIASDEINTDTLKKILRQNTPEKKILFWTIRSKENTTKKTETSQNKSALDYTLANCCRPLPGDPVQGFALQPNTIVIHHINCPEAVKLSSQFGNTIVEVNWFGKEQKAFLSEIKLSGIDRVGLVNDITNVLSKELSINIRSISFFSHDGIFEGAIELYVKSTDDLKERDK